MKGLPLINSSGLNSSAAHVRQFVLEATQLEGEREGTEEREAQWWECSEYVPRVRAPDRYLWSVSKGEDQTEEDIITTVKNFLTDFFTLY